MVVFPAMMSREVLTREPKELSGEFLLNFSLSNAALRGSHELSARRARRTKSSRLEGPPARGRGPTFRPLDF